MKKLHHITVDIVHSGFRGLHRFITYKKTAVYIDRKSPCNPVQNYTGKPLGKYSKELTYIIEKY